MLEPEQLTFLRSDDHTERIDPLQVELFTIERGVRGSGGGTTELYGWKYLHVAGDGRRWTLRFDGQTLADLHASLLRLCPNALSLLGDETMIVPNRSDLFSGREWVQLIADITRGEYRLLAHRRIIAAAACAAGALALAGGGIIAAMTAAASSQATSVLPNLILPIVLLLVLAGYCVFDVTRAAARSRRIEALLRNPRPPDEPDPDDIMLPEGASVIYLQPRGGHGDPLAGRRFGLRLAIGSLLLCWVPLLGIVLGAWGLGHALDGRSTATIGLLSSLGLAVAIIINLAYLVWTV